MFIYIIGSDARQKIGVSSDPSQRLCTLQTGNSETLKIHYCFEVAEKTAFKFEKYIHREQNHKRLRGEWFDMSAQHGTDLLKYYEIMKDSIILT
jgi:hypothetical protein